MATSWTQTIHKENGPMNSCNSWLLSDVEVKGDGDTHLDQEKRFDSPRVRSLAPKHTWILWFYLLLSLSTRN